MQVAHYPSQLDIISEPKIIPSEPNILPSSEPKDVLTSEAKPIRVKAHADSGTITLLIRQTSSEFNPFGGLQILSKNDKWVRVPNMPQGYILVNIGNLLSFWTNQRFQSTKHRVTNPKPGPGNRRISIAYFQKPGPDVEIRPIADGPQSQPQFAVKARNLIRVGVLDRLTREEGMSPEAARKEYHRLMKSPFVTGRGN